MPNKKRYYDIKPILKTNSDYNIIYGKRSNGKTFGACEVALTSYLNDGARVAYIRRYAEEITPRNIGNLFTPHPIEDLTDGNFNCFLYKSHRFNLAYADENGQITAIDSVAFCQTFALNTWERTKGADNGRFDYIIFDEFITRGNYLPNEFVIFLNVLSSLMRDRAGTKIFMLGNTVSTFCPYFEEMGIKPIIDELAQGEIRTFTNKDGLKVGIEYAADSDNTAAVNKYFSFNNPRLTMITSGKWETKCYPHLMERVTNDNILQRFYIDFDNKFIAADICAKNNEFFVHFHKGDKIEYDLQKHFKISDNPEINPLCSVCLYTPRYKAQKLLLDLINRQKWFFATDEIGEIIRSWLQHEMRLKQKFLD